MNSQTIDDAIRGRLRPPPVSSAPADAERRAAIEEARRELGASPSAGIDALIRAAGGRADPAATAVAAGEAPHVGFDGGARPIAKREVTMDEHIRQARDEYRAQSPKSVAVTNTQVR